MIVLTRAPRAAFALLVSAACALACAFSPTASAQELRIGMGADITSVDPHFVNLFPNNNIAWHQIKTWATKKGIVYVPRTDEYTLAHQFRPK